jgi:hypothetical protein
MVGGSSTTVGSASMNIAPAEAVWVDLRLRSGDPPPRLGGVRRGHARGPRGELRARDRSGLDLAPRVERFDGGPVALLALAIESARHEALDARRPLLAGGFGERGRVAIELERDEHRSARAFEWEPARERAEGDGADRVDVGALVGARRAADLLGRHVGEGAERRVERGERRLIALGARNLRDAEVEDLRALGPLGITRTLDEDVARLEIAVDDACRVRGDESLEHVVDEGADLAERQVLLALEPVGERLAGELLEHEQMRAVVGLIDAEQTTDERALDGARDLRLALEAFDEIGLHRRSLQQHLDRDLAPVGVVDGSPDFAHASTPEQSGDAVAGEPFSGVDRHGSWIGTVPLDRLRGERENGGTEREGLPAARGGSEARGLR